MADEKFFVFHLPKESPVLNEKDIPECDGEPIFTRHNLGAGEFVWYFRKDGFLEECSNLVKFLLEKEYQRNGK